jgi:hypothetical protein
MTMIPLVAQALQTVFTDQADEAARLSGFCQRTSALGGRVFAQAMTFGCLANPLPTLDNFCNDAAAAGAPVSPQAFDKRFGPASAEFLRLTLANAVNQVVASEPLADGLLSRFTSVLIQDSSTVSLPDCLDTIWKGTGGRVEANTRSAVKFQVRLDLRNGQLTGPFPDHGKSSDSKSCLQQDEPPVGGLRIADLGYFELDVFTRIDRGDAYWLSRWQHGTALYLPKVGRINLTEWLAKQSSNSIDLEVKIGCNHHLRGRLVAIRVPDEVAEIRRKRLLEKARDKGKPVSADRMALCAWTLLLTNIPETLANATELAVLARCRWQIELLFKLWKSGGGLWKAAERLGKSRSEKPYRILTEVYARLVAAVVQHWILVAGCWNQPNRSLVKAAKAVRVQVMGLIGGLRGLVNLEGILQTIILSLSAGTKIHTSKKDPRTHQIIRNPSHYRVSLS